MHPRRVSACLWLALCLSACGGGGSQDASSPDTLSSDAAPALNTIDASSAAPPIVDDASANPPPDTAPDASVQEATVTPAVTNGSVPSILPTTPATTPVQSIGYGVDYCPCSTQAGR